MTDLATDVTTETPSTVIDTEAGPSASGGGVPNLTEPTPQDDKPLSLREDIEAAFKEDTDAKTKESDPQKVEDKSGAKDDKQPRDPKADDAKAKEAEPVKEPEKAEKPGDDTTGEAKGPKEAKPEEKSDGVKFHEPPKKFLPDSREVWRNVPRAVRRDIDTMVQEHEAERTRFQEVSDRYDRLRDFDELATKNGRDLRESLTRVNQIENMMRRNPIAGINAILMEVGPRKADGQPLSLYEVAQFIAQQGPEGYQRIVAQQPQQQQQQAQPDPEVAQLKQQLAQMQEQQLASAVIEPFKAKHPRFDELEDDIAFFLQSGKISASLSPMERLGAAYDMAVRINPAPHSASASNDPEPALEEARRADTDFSGSKSIKSSPGSVTEQVDDQAKGGESIRDSLLKEMKRLNRA